MQITIIIYTIINTKQTLDLSIIIGNVVHLSLWNSLIIQHALSLFLTPSLSLPLSRSFSLLFSLSYIYALYGK